MIEYEVKLPKIDIADMQRRLRASGASLVKPATIYRNSVFNLPLERKIENSWLRVRDEGDKVTMSLKIIGERIADQHEYCFVADSMEEGEKFLRLIGAEEKSRQEKRRETWALNGCEVVIDEWPFLEPLAEIEGKSEVAVLETVALLGFQEQDCRVSAADVLYAEKYGVKEDVVNNHTPMLIFDMPNPFIP